MRIVHTGDVHLDACFAGGGMSTRVANRRRQSLRDVLHAILARAVESRADAVLIAGDLFDLERVTRDTVAFLRSEFEAIRPIPVVIAPGNHDPYVSHSPYATEAWSENVFIFTRPVWESIVLCDGALVVHGFAFDGYEISLNPFGTLLVPQEEAMHGVVHVAIGHGSERTHQPPDGKSYAPFDADIAADSGLAYFALGHFHAATEVTGQLGVPMWYSGTPEGHGFDEPGTRCYLEVEIEDGVALVQETVSSRTQYASHAVDCSGLTSAQELVDALRAIAEAYPTPPIVRVCLEGTCLPSIAEEIPSVFDAVSPQFEYLTLTDETCPADDYEDIARENTTLGQFVEKLNALIPEAPDPERRALLERARETGLAAYRNRKLVVRGLDLRGDPS